MKALFLVDEAQALLLETGFSRPVTKLKLSHKAEIKSTLIEYHCLVKPKASMDQFLDGLGDVSMMLRRFQDLSKQLFVAHQEQLPSG